MASPGDISSAKEHWDVLATLLLLTAAALLGTCLWIFNHINKNNGKTAEIVEGHTKQIAKLWTCISKVVTAHNINHDQDIQC